MASTSKPSSLLIGRERWGRLATRCTVSATLLLITILLQIAGRAYSSEFSGYPDEPAHFVTGLMIRDYIAAGVPGDPVAYAENYYLHYPKVSFGWWGPLLHVTEAAWMLLFPPSRTSVLVLMAMITTATAVLLYEGLVPRAGLAPALGAALLFVANPTVQRYTGMVMADGMVALMDLAAALAFARFLSTGNWRYSAGFGVFACLSILTKSNGVALFLLPLFAVVFSRQFSLLKRASFWIGPALAVSIAGPWQYYSTQKVLSGISVWRGPFASAASYTLNTLTVSGLVVIPFAALGIYDQIIRRWRSRQVEAVSAAAAALLSSVWLFHCLTPSAGFEGRYLIAAIPPALAFAAAGTLVVSRKLRFLSVQYRVRAAIVALLALFFVTGFTVPQKAWHGFDEVAALLQRPEYKDALILVSSEADGEGLLISEIAMREARPSHVVLRASKMLSQSDWNSNRYHLLYSNPDELMAFLKEAPVDVVVLDNDRRSAPLLHHELLKRTIAAFAQDWVHLGTYPRSRAGKASIELFRFRSPRRSGNRKIGINLPYTLGRPIEGNP